MTPVTRFFAVARTGLTLGNIVAPHNAYAERLTPAYGVDWDDSGKRRADCVYVTTSADTAAALARKAGDAYAVYMVAPNEAPLVRDIGEDAPGKAYACTVPPTIVRRTR